MTADATNPVHVSPFALWKEAGGGTKDYDPGRYRALMREHGLLLRPGDEGYEETSPDLPCGWPGRGTGPGRIGTVHAE